ncbi:MAG: sensor domain-containing diguanylate cyclase [Nitrospirota bacterium]
MLKPITTNADVKELIDLLEVAKLVVSTLDLDQVLQAILKSALKLTGTSAGSIALYNNHSKELEIHAHRGLSEGFIGNTKWSVRPGGLTEKILNSSKPTVISNTTNKKFFTNPLALNEGIKSMVCVPLKFKDDIIGILYVDDFTPRKFHASELGLLSILSSFAAMSIDHAKLHARTKKMAFTDSLTTLYNHRHFMERLDSELLRAGRYDESFSLMMIDIDDFKKVNDSHGHIFGDKVLHHLGVVLRSSVRETDTAARYGGEEFGVLLPKVSSERAAVMADRIRKRIRTKTLSLMRGKDPLTVSIGVSNYPADGKNRIDLIRKADKALYEAKKRGKDQAVEYRELKKARID